MNFILRRGNDFFFDKNVNFIIMAMVMTQRIQSGFETNPNASRMLSKAEV